MVGRFPKITTNNVAAPVSDMEFSDEQYHYLQQSVSPLEDDGNH